MQTAQGEQVVAYFSHTFTHPESKYCITRLELLLVILSIWHFHSYLYGQRFLLQTDHASLTWFLNFKTSGGTVGPLAGDPPSGWLSPANADSLSHQPCEEDECHYCLREDERDAVVLMVAGLQDTATNGGGRSDWLRLQTTTSARTMMRRVSSSPRVKTLPLPGSKPGWGQTRDQHDQGCQHWTPRPSTNIGPVLPVEVDSSTALGSPQGSTQTSSNSWCPITCIPRYSSLSTAQWVRPL